MSNEKELLSPFIIIELAYDLTIIEINKVPKEYEKSHFINQAFHSFLPPSDRKFFLERIEIIKKNREPLNFIYSAPADNFDIHSFQTQLQIKPKKEGFTLFSMDIEANNIEREKPNNHKLIQENSTLKSRIEDLENEFELQLKNYDIFVNNAPVAMYDIDLEGLILTSNKRAQEFFHVQSSFDLKKHYFFEFVHEDDHEEVETFFSLACEGIERYFTFKSSKKDFQIFKSCFIPIRDFSNNVIKLFSLTEDITKEYLAEEVLKNKVAYQTQENSRKDQLIFKQSRHVQMAQLIKMIAHQWRQPLSYISTLAGNVEVMADLDRLDKNEIKKSMQKINEQSQILSKIISDFKDFYKPQKIKTKIFLKDIGDTVIEVMQNSLIDDGISFQRESKAVHELYTFKNEVTQVILNLLQNAQETLKERKIQNPKISLTSYETKEYQIIEVTDNGKGISEDIIDNIFDPYFSTKTTKNGCGLGLHMAKTMIESHCEGFIFASNDEEGAKFTIKLPNNCDTTV